MRAFVYLAYHSNDRRCIDCLHRLMRPLVRFGLTIFDPSHLIPGESVKSWTHDALHASHMAIVLVSKDLLYEDSLISDIVTPLVNRQQRGELSLLWLLASPCVYELSPMCDLEPAHDTTRPLSTLSDVELDVILLEICDRIWRRWIELFSMSAGPIDTISFIVPSVGLEQEDHYRELRLAYEIFNRQRKSYTESVESQLTANPARRDFQNIQNRTRKRRRIFNSRWQRSVVFIIIARDIAAIVAAFVYVIRILLSK